MACDSPLKGYKDKDTGGITFRRENSVGEKMEVGCGQCLGCRLDYSRMWAMRISHESSLHEFSGGNCFITLTYRSPWECTPNQFKNGLYVPEDFSLNDRHMVLFLKRLRRAFPNNKVRYFYAGEYGKTCKHGFNLDVIKCGSCNCGRPHYHVCLFGLSFDDLEAYHTDGAITRYTSPTLERIWGYGFVDVGELNFNSAGYVSKYILKKIGGMNKTDHYMSFDEYGVVTFIMPEFVRMSRGRPCKLHKKANIDCPDCELGIGAKWWHKYKRDIYPSDCCPVPGNDPMKGVPRYYDKLLERTDPELLEAVKTKRKEYYLENKEEFTHDRLLAKHKVKKAKVELFSGRKL